MKKVVEITATALLILSGLFISGCENKIQNPDFGGYPPEVGRIITTQCAVTGCHDQQGAGGCNGLDLTSWNSMYNASVDGSVTIPYSSEFSTLFLFTNTYTDLGSFTPPSMPLYRAPLSRNQVSTLKNWIDDGAPNNAGFVMWSDNASRPKFYICNQGCDNVAVFDEKTQLIMRYIDVGVGSHSPAQAPHDIQVSPDGKYWYIVFYNGLYMQKFETTDDKLVGEVNLGAGSWNTFTISEDGSKAFCVNWAPSSTASVACVDLNMMKVTATYGGGLFTYPHGSILAHHDSILYVTCNSGNFVYKINVVNPTAPKFMRNIIVDGSGVSNSSSVTGQPHALEISPDGNYMYVTCQADNDLAVIQLSNDSVIAHIPTGLFPQEMSFSASTNYLFVSCMEDTVNVNYPLQRGAISIVNYKTNTLVKTIYAGWQPHGVAVDDKLGYVYIACRNASVGGPAPHHTTACAGKDGYMTVIDLSTLAPDPRKRVEVSVDPYEITIRQ